MRCLSCNRITKDAERVEDGKDYICAICLVVMARKVTEYDKTYGADNVPPKPRIRKRKRLKTPRGSEVSLGKIDIKNPYNMNRGEHSESNLRENNSGQD